MPNTFKITLSRFTNPEDDDDPTVRVGLLLEEVYFPNKSSYFFMDSSNVKELRDKLNEMFPAK